MRIFEEIKKEWSCAGAFNRQKEMGDQVLSLKIGSLSITYVYLVYRGEIHKTLIDDALYRMKENHQLCGRIAKNIGKTEWDELVQGLQ